MNESTQARLQNEPPSEPVLTNSGATPSIPPVDPKKRRYKRRKVLLPLLILGVVFLIGGTALAYSGYVERKPSTVLKRAVQKIPDSNTYKSATFSGTFDVWPRKDAQPGVTFEGSFNQNRDYQIKLDLSYVLIMPTIEIKKVGNNIYLRLDNFKPRNEVRFANENPGDEEIFDQKIADIVSAVGPSKINGVWYSIDKTSASGLASLAGLELPETSGVENGFVNQLKTPGVFNMKQYIGKENVGGVESFHYIASTSKEGLKQLVNNLANSAGSAQTYADRLENGISNSNIDHYNFDVWVDTKEKIINKLSFDSTHQMPEDQIIKMNFELKDINKNTTIEKPETAKPLEPFIKEALTQTAVQKYLR
ncbi:MAG: hypothetical protein AAB896_03095 [Patescibacteria group bacterium]